MPKGGCQPNRLTGGFLCRTAAYRPTGDYPSDLALLGHPQAPFVCFADIFPANGEICPLGKGGLLQQSEQFLFLPQDIVDLGDVLLREFGVMEPPEGSVREVYLVHTAAS